YVLSGPFRQIPSSVATRWRPRCNRATEAATAEVRITKRGVDNAEPRASRYTMFDSALPGFGLRVYPSGSKSYVFEYRPGAGGRSTDKKRVTIGKVGDLTPDQGRKEAGRLRAAVVNGHDPQGLKAAQRS